MALKHSRVDREDLPSITILHLAALPAADVTTRNATFSMMLELRSLSSVMLTCETSRYSLRCSYLQDSIKQCEIAFVLGERQSAMPRLPPRWEDAMSQGSPPSEPLLPSLGPRPYSLLHFGFRDVSRLDSEPF